MKCFYCNAEVRWNNDFDTEDTYPDSEHNIVSNLSCPNCHSSVDVWHPSEKLIKEYKEYEEKKNDK